MELPLVVLDEVLPLAVEPLDPVVVAPVVPPPLEVPVVPPLPVPDELVVDVVVEVLPLVPPVLVVEVASGAAVPLQPDNRAKDKPAMYFTMSILRVTGTPSRSWRIHPRRRRAWNLCGVAVQVEPEGLGCYAVVRDGGHARTITSHLASEMRKPSME